MDEVKRERESRDRWIPETMPQNVNVPRSCSDLSVLESRHGADMQFGPCSDPTAIWFQTCLTAPVPRSGPQLGPRPGTESNLSPGPNPNKLGHGPGTEFNMSPGLDPTAVWSQAWIRSQPVPRPGPSSVTGLDPKSELKGSIELIGSYHI